MDNVFVIRYASHTREDDSNGNFELCYHDEEEAKKAMCADFDQKFADCKSDYPGFNVETTKSGDYCGIVVMNDYDTPTFEWWIDKIGVTD